MRRGKEVAAAAERERASLLSKMSVYGSRQDAQLNVIAESAEALAELQANTKPLLGALVYFLPVYLYLSVLSLTHTQSPKSCAPPADPG